MAVRRQPDHGPRPRDGWWDNQLKSRYAFKPETGALLVFPDRKVCLYKGGWTPTAMEKGVKTGGRWIFTRGSDLLDIGRMTRQVQTYRREQAQALADGAATKTPPSYKCEVFARWLETVPDPVLRVLKRQRTRSWQWYAFLARIGEPALELASPPRVGGHEPLAFLLANAWVFFGRDRAVRNEMRRIRSLVTKRRRDILGRLGFPGTNAAVRVLARIPRQTLSINAMLFLRRAIASDPRLLRRLSHLPRLNAGVIRVISDPCLLAHCSHSLLVEIGRRRGCDISGGGVARFMDDTIAMLPDRGAHRTVFQSFDHLHSVHDQEAAQYRARGPGTNVLFGPPPIPGVGGAIEYLPDTHALWTEASRMHNCLASPHYARSVIRQQLWLYRVLEPERCSLAIEHDPAHGRYRIREIRTAHNQRTSKRTLRTVQAWLSGHADTPHLFDPPDHGTEAQGE